MKQVCFDKGFDVKKFEARHPGIELSHIMFLSVIIKSAFKYSFIFYLIFSYIYNDYVPDNFDEQLRPECTLSDYRLTEVALFPVNSRGIQSASNASMSSRSVSSSDILRLQQQQNNSIVANPSIIDNAGSGRRVGNTRLVCYFKFSEIENNKLYN